MAQRFRERLKAVWHAVVPPGDPNGPLPPLLLVLTFVTGLVDAFSYLDLGHVFVANMTGNVVFLAFALVGANGFSVIASLTAFAAFAAGSLLGGRLSVVCRGRAHLLVVAATVEAALAAVAVVVSALSGVAATGGPRYGLIALLAVAMGVQNAAARKLAVPDMTTTVLTLTTTAIFADARAVGGSGSRAARRVASILTMFLGAVVGAALVIHGQRTVVLVIAGVLLAVVALATSRLARTGPAWARP